MDTWEVAADLGQRQSHSQVLGSGMEERAGRDESQAAGVAGSSGVSGERTVGGKGGVSTSVSFRFCFEVGES